MIRVPLTILITALVTGLILLIGICHSSNKPVHPTTLVKQQQPSISYLDKHYLAAIGKLKQRAESLQDSLSSLQKNFGKQKDRLLLIKQKLVTLNLKVKADVNPVNYCDSLRNTANGYMLLSDSTQHSAESALLDFKNLVAIKDSQLVLCTHAYLGLKTMAESNLERERELTSQLSIALKAQRRKIWQNKLLAGGFLILSGITTTLYLNAAK